MTAVKIPLLPCLVAAGIFSLSACVSPRPEISSALTADWRGEGAGAATPEAAADRFMGRLFRAETDLLRDRTFRRENFSTALEQGTRDSIARYDIFRRSHPYGNHPAAPDPHNGTLYDAWDFPTSFRLLSTRRTTAGDRAEVDVRYRWGSQTQYRGTTRLVTVELVRERNRWYVDDLLNHRTQYNPDQRLSAALRKPGSTGYPIRKLE